VPAVFTVSLSAFIGAALIHRYLVQRAKTAKVVDSFADERPDAFPITSPLDVISES